MSGQPTISDDFIREATPAHRPDAETPNRATTGRAGLPEGKEAFGFVVIGGEYLPVVRNERKQWSMAEAVRRPVYHYSYTVWQDGAALAENYSQRDWDRLVERGEAYEVEQ